MHHESPVPRFLCFCSCMYVCNYRYRAIHSLSLSECIIRSTLNSLCWIPCFVNVLDWAWVDWGDECWPSDGATWLHVWPGLERPLGDIHTELAAVHRWSATADAPAAGGGIQPSFRGTVHIRKALPPPPPLPWPLQPRAAAPPLRRRSDQLSRHNE